MNFLRRHALEMLAVIFIVTGVGLWMAVSRTQGCVVFAIGLIGLIARFLR
jgi:hypothetical protein